MFDHHFVQQLLNDWSHVERSEKTILSVLSTGRLAIAFKIITPYALNSTVYRSAYSFILTHLLNTLPTSLAAFSR